MTLKNKILEEVRRKEKILSQENSFNSLKGLDEDEETVCTPMKK